VLETHDPCFAVGHEEAVALPPDCAALCTVRSNILRFGRPVFQPQRRKTVRMESRRGQLENITL
jgi:hypothetical protein